MNRQRARSCRRWAFCSSARKAAILRHLPAGLVRLRKISSRLFVCAVRPTTPTPLSARVQTSAASASSGSGGSCRVSGWSAGAAAFTPCCCRTAAALGASSTRSRMPPRLCFCSCCKDALEQQPAVVQDAHLIHHLLDLAQQVGWRSARWLRWSGAWKQSDCAFLECLPGPDHS